MGPFMLDIFFIHSSDGGHLKRLRFLAINDVALNICVEVFVWTCVFNFLRYRPMNGIAGSYGHSMINILNTFI